jgi:hypothetical protein
MRISETGSLTRSRESERKGVKESESECEGEGEGEGENESERNHTSSYPVFKQISFVKKKRLGLRSMIQKQRNPFIMI